MFVAQVVTGGVLLLRELGWLQPAELAVYDRLIAGSAGRSVSQRVLIVSLTEADIGRYGWPLRDQDLALLLRRLTHWGADGIGIDIYRDHPLPPGQQELAQVLQQRPEIFSIYKLADDDGQGVPPPPALADSSRAVLADVVTDAGGVVRRGLLAATDASKNRTVSTLGTALAIHYAGRQLRPTGDDVAFGQGRVVLVTPRFGPYARVDAAGYQMLLDYRGGRGRFKRIGLGDLLRSDAAASLVRGQVVVIGTEAPSVKDNFATPFSTGLVGGEPFTGVMLHAALADQLLRIQAGETTSLAVLPRATETVIIWGCAMGAAVMGGTLPTIGVAFAALLIAGVGLIVWAAQAAFDTAGLVLPAAPGALAWISSAAGALWMLYGVGMRERLRLRRSFEHYLDPRIIEDLLAAESLPSFGGERREVSVMFTDIASFTALAETLPAEQIAALLRDYFDGVCAAILECGGLVSVFHGDGLQVLFGAPRRQDDHADRAVEAALRIDAFAAGFSDSQQERGVPFGMTRIGVHTAVALVGNVGTRARLNYGAVGDMVNTAARLETLNKRVGTRIAVSAETARRCVRHRFRPVGEFVLRGRREALAVATPLTLADMVDPQHVVRYEAAYDALRAGHPNAGTMFQALGPDDPCAVFHHARLACGEVGTCIVMKDK